MLPMQSDLNISGVPIGDFLEQTWKNLWHGGYNTAAGVLGFLIVALVLTGLKVNKAISITLGFGGFWAGWLSYNTFFNKPDRELFPGKIQAHNLWDSMFSNPLALIITSTAAIGTFIFAKSVKLFVKIFLAIAALFAGSLIYNLLVNINWK